MTSSRFFSTLIRENEMKRGYFWSHTKDKKPKKLMNSVHGYRSHLVRFPSERFSVAIECNLDAINLGPLADQVADLYLEDKLAPKQRPKSTEATPEVETAPSETDSPSAATLSDYAGEYWSGELQVTYHLFMEDGDLYSQVQMNPATPLRLLAEDVLSADQIKMTFVRDEKEHIQSFILDAGRVRNLSFVRK